VECGCRLVAVVSSLTWRWLLSLGAGWGCTPVMYYLINAHRLNQPPTNKQRTQSPSITSLSLKAPRVVMKPSRGRINATSLQQPKTQPRLCQEGQQPKAPVFQEGDGGTCHLARLVEGGFTEGCSRPSNELHYGLAADPHPAHPDNPPTAHTQRHLRQPRQ